ncbi:MAG: cadherin repeat domain-containing protein, partial [Pseudomonadales bacterium]
NNTVIDTFVVTVTAVADVPNLTVADNAPTTDEDIAINLGIASRLVDTDGSETLEVTISGLPANAELTDGLNTSSAASTDVSGWTLSDITVVSAPHRDEDMVLTVTTTATEGSNASFETVQEVINLTVIAVADTPTLSVSSSVTTNEDEESTALGINTALVDTDGSETLTVTVTGLPTGASIQDGTFSINSTSAGQVHDITGWNYPAITTTPRPNNNATYVLTVNSLATEANDGADTANISDTIEVDIISINDVPTLENPIAVVAVDEDAANTVLDLSAVFADVDIASDGQAVTLSITGNTNSSLFTSAVLSGSSGGIDNTTLTLDYAAEQNGFSDITITALDSGGLSVSDTFRVTVNAVDDAPFVIDPAADVVVAEDAADSVIDIGTVFDDVDIITNADELVLSVTANTNPALFDSVSLSSSYASITN